jgi:hypothetical protein
VTRAMAGGAILAVVVGALQPPPWLLAFALVGILLGVWLFAVDRMLRLDVHGPIRARLATTVGDDAPEAQTPK